MEASHSRIHGCRCPDRHSLKYGPGTVAPEAWWREQPDRREIALVRSVTMLAGLLHRVPIVNFLFDNAKPIGVPNFAFWL